MVAFAGLIYDAKMCNLSLMLGVNLLLHCVSSQVSFFGLFLPAFIIFIAIILAQKLMAVFCMTLLATFVSYCK